MTGARIALRALRVVPVAVLVKVRPLGSVNGEGIDDVSVAVRITVGAPQHATEGAGSRVHGTGVLSIRRTVVVVVEVLTVVLAAVSVRIVAQRGGEIKRTGGAKIDLNRRDGASPSCVGEGSVANAIVVVVNVLTRVLATILVVVRGFRRRP